MTEQIPNFERSKLDYEQVIGVFSLLTEVRFKLIALIPTVSGTAAGLLTAGGLSGGVQAVIATVGFVVTLGVVFYDQRNTQLYNNAFSRAAHLEGDLTLAPYESDVAGGLFGSRTERPRKLFGFVPMKHDRGLGLIYAASLAAWAFAALQGLVDLRTACAAAAVVGVAFHLEFERLDRSKRRKGERVMADTVQIPAKFLNSDGADFAAPISTLLRGLGLLGKDNEFQPDALNELQEGALKFSKWAGGLAGGAGIAGIATAVASAFTHAHEPTRVALVSGGSVIAAAAVIAVALVVQADARARARTTVAQYEARSSVSGAFIALANALLRPSAKASGDGSNDLLYAFADLPRNLLVRAKNHDQEMHVRGIRRTAGGDLQVRLEDGDWVPDSEIGAFHLDE